MNKIFWLLSFYCATMTLSHSGEAQSDIPEEEKRIFLRHYDAAKSAGHHDVALKLLVSFLEKTQGQDADVTLKTRRKLGQRYFEDKKYTEAIALFHSNVKKILKKNGKHHLQLFEPYFQLARAYSLAERDMKPSKKYYDLAIKVLKQNNKDKTELFAKANLYVAIDMMIYDNLTGNYATTASISSGLFTTDGGLTDAGDMRNYRNEYNYKNDWYKAEKYLERALNAIAGTSLKDPFLREKILIALTKIQLLETADYQNVQAGVSGRYSKNVAHKKYTEQDSQLRKAMNRLAENPELNRDYLQIGNKVMMQISVQRENMESLRQFCESGSVDDSAKYASARVFDVEADGSVIAPQVSTRIQKTIFRDTIPPRARAELRPRRLPKVYFLPVCIHNTLKAVLIGKPSVRIESIDE
ncbi:hypothetical protein QGN29_06705 [Temperatibacter marinus]|uniref:Tetratricopeptide repeat protein n=1 Tax=Temperatibacter marinus TaxID=1456591 RepID=A0AA52EI46_9PROT|nr:hypothetical protein [Temperatibacter marinus]WND04063.1 hypothetical protein QGN29_06705 [Temperatibacter marinus]